MRWSKTWTVTSSWILRRGSPSSPPAIAIPKWWPRFRSQAAQLIHMSCTDFYYEGMVELAEKLAAIAPGRDAKRVYFGNSGTEAIETAMKLARYHTKREKFIAFYGSFHGRTMGSLSLTASKSVQRKGFGSLVPGVFHAHFPNTYRGACGIRPEHAAEDALAYIEDVLFRRVVAPDDVAGIFIEPIQGEGGYIPAPPEFLEGLERLCRQHDILLIADEVQSGMGRTGKWWASERLRDRAGHSLHGEGDCFRHAAQCGDRKGGGDGLEARRACFNLWG